MFWIAVIAGLWLLASALCVWVIAPIAGFNKLETC